MTVLRCTAIVRVKKTRRVMVALDMDSASMESALAKTVGEVLTATHVALVTDSAAVETESALMESASATLDGLAMLVISEPACMIALNTDIATTVLASAKRDTVGVIALFLLSLNLASVPFIACAVVSNSAPRFMRPRGLDLRMSAIPSVPRNVFLSASLVRCPCSPVPPTCPQSRSTSSVRLDSKA